mmetsp:Transcript_18371/g.30859  ORF Transcript_18371/g.30859 Transcript_18371/m.30859 type:complete len:326 (+) Transcript_18371:165-1142(+)
MPSGKGSATKRGRAADKPAISPGKETKDSTKETKPKSQRYFTFERIASLFFPLFLTYNVGRSGFKLYEGYIENYVVPLHEPQDFVDMREAGRMVASALDHVEHFIREGASTYDVDKEVELYAVLKNVTSATLGYKGFPNSCCISVNDVVLHGIPSKTVILKRGDVVKLDIALIVDGWYADSCRTIIVGGATRKATESLVRMTEQALELGVQACGPGKYSGDIGAVMREHLEAGGFSAVTKFGGHGIGRKFHSAPGISNGGTRGSGTFLKEGMFFTIEPIATLGSTEVTTLADGWTTVSADGLVSAQFEHTVGVTASGCEIFTTSL